MPNAVISKVGAGGKVCLFVNVATDLVVDVGGYFPQLTRLVSDQSCTRARHSRRIHDVRRIAARRWAEGRRFGHGSADCRSPRHTVQRGRRRLERDRHGAVRSRLCHRLSMWREPAVGVQRQRRAGIDGRRHGRRQDWCGWESVHLHAIARTARRRCRWLPAGIDDLHATAASASAGNARLA